MRSDTTLSIRESDDSVDEYSVKSESSKYICYIEHLTDSYLEPFKDQTKWFGNHGNASHVTVSCHGSHVTCREIRRRTVCGESSRIAARNVVEGRRRASHTGAGGGEGGGVSDCVGEEGGVRGCDGVIHEVHSSPGYSHVTATKTAASSFTSRAIFR